MVHICAPRPTSRALISAVCPDCERATQIISIYYEWYGPSATCIRCGRTWQDGEWMPLAFSRTARRDNIRAAKKAYRNAKED